MPTDDKQQTPPVIPGNRNQWTITSPSRCLGSACGLCIEQAPENFSWQTPYEDRVYVHAQPITELEDNNCLSAAVACPSQIISTVGEPE